MNNIFASKTNNAFYQTIFTGFFAIAAMLFLSLEVYRSSSLYLDVLIHKIKDGCGCTNMTEFFSMHPDIFRAIILFGIGIGIFIIYSLYKLIRSVSQTQKYTAHYLSFAKASHSAKLKAAIKVLGLDRKRVIEISSPDLAVFCFGFLEPKICISHALVNMLNKDELKAVLEHEAQHMISYEPLKILVVKYFHNIFFFLPGLKTSAIKYITFSELAADEKASGNSAVRSSLASAILKISECEENKRQNTNASLFSFSPLMEERANRLSDEAYTPKFKFIDRSLIAGSLGLAVISLLLIFIFSNSTKAFEMHHIASCVLPQGSNNDLVCNSTDNLNVRSADSDTFQILGGNNNFQQNSFCRVD